MSKAIISVADTTTIFQAAKMMEASGIGSIFVKKDGEPSGIITDRDYAIKVQVNKLPDDTHIDKVASFPLITINANDSILSAADLMSLKKIRKLAVHDDGKIVGVITSSDLVNHLARMK